MICNTTVGVEKFSNIGNMSVQKASRYQIRTSVYGCVSQGGKRPISVPMMRQTVKLTGCKSITVPPILNKQPFRCSDCQIPIKLAN